MRIKILNTETQIHVETQFIHLFIHLSINYNWFWFIFITHLKDMALPKHSSYWGRKAAIRPPSADLAVTIPDCNTNAFHDVTLRCGETDWQGHTQSVVTRLSPLQHPSSLSHTAHCSIVHTTHYTFHTTVLTGRSPLTAQISEAAGLPLRCSVYIMVRGIANLPEFLHDRPGKKNLR